MIKKSFLRQVLRHEDLIDLKLYLENCLARSIDIRHLTDHEIIEHFKTQATKLGIASSAKFDADFYIQNNQDVADFGADPLNHYVNFGQYDGRRPYEQYDRTEFLSERGKLLWQTIAPYFDQEFYIRQTGHPSNCDIDPLFHFVFYGSDSGTNPLRGFDAEFYKNTNEDVRTRPEPPLIHYLEHGFKEGRLSSPSHRAIQLDNDLEEAIAKTRPLFSPTHYFKQIPKLKNTTIDPAFHFDCYGARQQLDPNPDFSVSAYERRYNYGDDRHDNPLIRYSETDNRDCLKLSTTGFERVTAKKFEDGDLVLSTICTSFIPENTDQRADVCVIIPVYEGYDETLACLLSVLTAKGSAAFNVLVLDDCSPDEALSEQIQILSKRIGFSYSRNDANLGFVQNTQLGFRWVLENTNCHPLILNADTEVFDGWLDGLLQHLEHPERIATVTPFTNNGSIMSYPFAHTGTDYDLEISRKDLARLTLSNTAQGVQIVTGVGFCMLVSREAVEELGGFREDTFGRGYGEEVDFCLRASQQGYLNIAAPNVYVSHLGSISFGAERETLNAGAQETLRRLHPNFTLLVDDFLHADPLLPARRFIDTERLRLAVRDTPFVVSISHGLGGGTQRYINQITKMAFDAETNVVTFEFIDNKHVNVTTRWIDHSLELHNLTNVDLEEFKKLIEFLLGEASCRGVVCNSLVESNADMRRSLIDVLKRADKPTVSVIHDFSPICPRATLTRPDNTFCGNNSSCACIATTPDVIPIDMNEWTKSHLELFDLSSKIIVPDLSMLNYFDDDVSKNPKIEIVQHPEPVRSSFVFGSPEMPVSQRNVLRLAILGAIGPHKGSRLLLGLGEHCKRNSIPIEFHLVGSSDLNLDHLNGVVFNHGKYVGNPAAEKMLRRINPDGALLPSVWPETYCYALSIMLNLGLPTVAFDLGAQKTRLSAYPRGHLLAFDLRKNIPELTRQLLAIDWDNLWQMKLEQTSKYVIPTFDEYFGFKAMK